MRHHLMFSQDSAWLSCSEGRFGAGLCSSLLISLPDNLRWSSHSLSFASLGLWIPQNPTICWALYQDGSSHTLVSAGVHDKAHTSGFSPCPNTAHPTVPGQLTLNKVQRLALVQENIIRSLTWLELCGLRRLKSNFMLMQQFLWLRWINIIAPKLKWKGDVRILHDRERMGMINCPGSLYIFFRPNPPKFFWVFLLEKE